MNSVVSTPPEQPLYQTLSTIAKLPFVVVLLPICAVDIKACDYLSLQEQARIKRYRQVDDQQRSLAAHYLKRSLLACYTGVEPEQLVFSTTNHGKPVCLQPSFPLYFNLSHSGQWVALACSTQFEVGVDIEFPRKVNVDALMKRICTQQESLSHYTKGLSLERFFTLWAQKEAVSKTLGGGLASGVDNFSVSATFGTEKTTAFSRDYQIWTREHDNGVVACAAVQSDCNDLPTPRWFEYHSNSEEYSLAQNWCFRELYS